MEYTPNSCSTVVDNWLLEFACRLIDKESDRMYFGVDSYRGSYSRFGEEEQQRFLQEKLVSLMQLLDLVVTNDKLVFDADWSHFWMESGGLKPIAPILAEVRLGYNRKFSLSNTWHLDVKNDEPGIVQDGALYYSALARLLGTYYWPSPQRAKFLAENLYARTPSPAIVLMKEFADKKLLEAVNAALAPFSFHANALEFTGFGSTILANCSSREDILPVAMQFREEKASRAFRLWLQETDKALISGNIVKISQSLMTIREVLELTTKELHLKTGQEDKRKVELQIGLSPSISVDIDLDKTVKPLFKKFKQKPFHVVFLQKHFSQLLVNSNTWEHLRRLFPEIISYKTYDAIPKLQAYDLDKFQKALIREFNESELRELVMKSTKLEWEELSGESKDQKLADLFRFLERYRERLETLRKEACAKRPALVHLLDFTVEF